MSVGEPVISLLPKASAGNKVRGVSSIDHCHITNKLIPSLKKKLGGGAEATLLMFTVVNNLVSIQGIFK